ncbi:MAG: DUF1648 domain-containing protein [Corynebacterium sp.]|nr:DUF1648 domain-containing protein [Corynebacterium sp.]
MTQPKIDNSSRWLIASLFVIIAIISIGWWLYPSVTNPMPVHWNAAGIPDSFVEKSASTYFGFLMLGPGVILLIQLFVLLVTSSFQADARTQLMHAYTRRSMGQLCTVLSAVIGAGVLWAISGRSGTFDFWLLLLVIVFVCVWFVYKGTEYRKIVDAKYPPTEYDPEAFRGPLYWNKDDSRFAISLESGNMMLNFARPGAWFLIFALCIPGILIAVLAYFGSP